MASYYRQKHIHRNLLTSIGGKVALVCMSVGLLSACQDDNSLRSARAYQPIPESVLSRMDEIGANKYSPVLIRTFKKESELEVWKMKADGTYAHLKTYPMCRWSGQLGPKRREGDRQVPEGFYSIKPKHMNPNSAYYLSFNIGYPNAYDRAHGRSGSLIMVHGACSSRGCFSMSDKQIAEIYAVVREAFSGGQKAIQLQSLPFRMTTKNLAKHRLDKNIQFWKRLKVGADNFEITKREPSVLVCNRNYEFNATPVAGQSRVNPTAQCPPLQRNQTLLAAVKKKQRTDQAKVATLVRKKVRPVKLVYADGSQHRSFAHVTRVSRPEALARGPIEVALDNNGRPLKTVKKKVKTAAKGTAAKSNNTPSAKPAAASNQTQQPRVSTVARGTPPNKTRPASKNSGSWFSRLVGTRPVAKPATKPVPKPTTLLEPVRPAGPKPAQSGGPAKTKKPNSDKRANILPKIISGGHRRLPAGLSAYAPLSQ